VDPISADVVVENDPSFHLLLPIPNAANKLALLVSLQAGQDAAAKSIGFPPCALATGR
jgi:hypothetical protein